MLFSIIHLQYQRKELAKLLQLLGNQFDAYPSDYSLIDR